VYQFSFKVKPVSISQEPVRCCTGTTVTINAGTRSVTSTFAVIITATGRINTKCCKRILVISVSVRTNRTEVDCCKCIIPVFSLVIRSFTNPVSRINTGWWIVLRPQLVVEIVRNPRIRIVEIDVRVLSFQDFVEPWADVITSLRRKVFLVSRVTVIG